MTEWLNLMLEEVRRKKVELAEAAKEAADRDLPDNAMDGNPRRKRAAEPGVRSANKR